MAPELTWWREENPQFPAQDRSTISGEFSCWLSTRSLDLPQNGNPQKSIRAWQDLTTKSLSFIWSWFQSLKTKPYLSRLAKLDQEVFSPPGLSPGTLLFTSSPRWEFMDIYGYSWIFMDIYGCSSQIFSQNIVGLSSAFNEKTHPLVGCTAHSSHPSEVHGVVTPQPWDHPRSTGAHGIWTFPAPCLSRGQSIHHGFLLYGKRVTERLVHMVSSHG